MLKSAFVFKMVHSSLHEGLPDWSRIALGPLLLGFDGHLLEWRDDSRVSTRLVTTASKHGWRAFHAP